MLKKTKKVCCPVFVELLSLCLKKLTLFERALTLKSTRMVTKIVLTGGPCAGKSTILKRIKEKYEKIGWAVYMLPESATLFIEAGANFLTSDSKLLFETEKSKLQFQLAMEDYMAQIANASGKPALIVCDRGAMDTAAYMDRSVWQRIQIAIGMNETALRDDRYAAVLHICTAAKGAEDFYTLLNNKCRSESPEVAREVDDRLLAVWKGHPNLHVIQAEIDFEDKIKNVLNTLDQIIKPVKMKNLSMIAAVGQNLELGYKNQLLCHLPIDLKHFKTITSGHTVLMGDRTWESLPKKPLPNRRNIVITLDDVEFPDCETVHSIEDALKLIEGEDEAFIMGGATMYKLFLPYANKLYLTRIASQFTADVYFPTINQDEWTVTEDEFVAKDEKNEYDLNFQTLIRR